MRCPLGMLSIWSRPNGFVAFSSFALFVLLCLLFVLFDFLCPPPYPRFLLRRLRADAKTGTDMKAEFVWLEARCYGICFIFWFPGPLPEIAWAEGKTDAELQT